jgi:hypothetical protein
MKIFISVIGLLISGIANAQLVEEFGPIQILHSFQPKDVSCVSTVSKAPSAPGGLKIASTGRTSKKKTETVLIEDNEINPLSEVQTMCNILESAKSSHGQVDLLGQFVWRKAGSGYRVKNFLAIQITGSTKAVLPSTK